MVTYRRPGQTFIIDTRRALPVLICTGFLAGGAAAQNIDTETTLPVTSSTIANGAPGDINVTEDGSIVLTGTPGQVAITVDSDNSITLDGTIESEDTNDSTGIRIEPGFTGDIRGAGEILLIEDYTREDDDDDDDLDGPLALGENKIGLELVAGGTHTGDIEFENGSAITVEGNNSAGILLRSALDGSFTTDGTLSVIGENAIGLEADAGITGDVLFSGSLSAQGANAVGVSLDGDIGGNLTVEGSILASGFTSLSATNYIAPSLVDDDTDSIDERLDAEDINPGGPALAIGGSLADGFLINGNIDDFISEEDADDETKDTIEDFDENRNSGTVTSIGSGQAILISPDLDGPATSGIVLGPVSETVRDTLDDDEDDDVTEILANFDYEQGLINRGTITANGLNIGFTATALEITGSADGAYTTEVQGGMLNSGTIQASAFEEDARAIILRSGTIVPQLDNDGSIIATSSTTDGHNAMTLEIAAGAELTRITNNGSMISQANGDSGNAITIRDLSDTLTDITNTGTISAIVAEDGLAETDLGVAYAIDLSQSTQDITYLQRRVTPTEDKNADDEIDADDERTPILIGDVLFGSGDDSFTVNGGSVTGDTYFGAGDADISLRAMTYTGDVHITDGATSYSAINSTLTGDLHFLGESADMVLQDSIFDGDIYSEGGLDAVSIIDSELLLTIETAAQIESLSITGESILEVDLDPRLSTGEASLTVETTAILGDEVTIRPVLETITSSDFTHTFVAAEDIQFDGTLDDALIEEAPYIYNVSLAVTEGETDRLDLQFALKTADELGLDSNQAAAYSAVLDVFSSDDDLGTALAAISEADEFNQVYNLLLPQRTEASTRYLSAQASAAFGALANRLDAITLRDENRTGFWVEEFYTQVDIDQSTNVPGYNGDGFGFSLGADRALLFLDIAGVYLNYSSGDFEEKTGGRNPVTTSSLGLGVYAKESVGALDMFVSGQISSVDFFSTRALTLDELPYELEGDWDGTSTAISAGISSRFDSGVFYARPKLSVDYFQLNQDAYTETGDELLAASVDPSDTDRMTATAAVGLGAQFTSGRNQRVIWSPELNIGYRSELSSTAYTADVQYLGSDEAFSIISQETYSDAVLAGLSLSTNSSLLTARFGYDVEVADDGLVHYGGATVKLKF